MNCDTAFDLMTESHGSQSAALAGHLAECPRCRRMQETLAPALDFLNETAVSMTEAIGEPTNWSNVPAPRTTSAATGIAQDLARQLTGRPGMRQTDRNRRLAWAASATVAACAGFALALWLFPSRSENAAAVPTACTRHLAARDDQSRTPADILALVQSCARCHGETPAAVPVETSLVPRRVPARQADLPPLRDEYPSADFAPLAPEYRMLAVRLTDSGHSYI